ncbi:HAD-IIB family hydrolase [Brachybacterium sp. DNPG3]
MTGRRCVLIDFDGTIADQGIVPAAHVEAISRVRAAGHAVVLCTGRSEAIVADEVLALFDGAVTSAGAHMRIGGEVLRDERFPRGVAERIVDVMLEHEVVFALEAPEALYCPPSTRPYLTARPRTVEARPGDIGGGIGDLVDAVVEAEDLRSRSFAKIALWGSPVPVDDLAAAVGPELATLPNSIADDGTSSGEIFLRHLDKADGVRRIAEHLGLGIDATIGIGDGMNDLGMLRTAGTAVAVEGSPAPLLEVADLVIPPPARHGLVTAFESLELV